MRTLKLTALLILNFVAFSKINAQTSQNDSIKLDYTKIYSLALDGNPKLALPLLEIDPAKKISQKDLKFKTNFENRFKFEEDKSDFLETRKSKIDQLLKIYRDYWRFTFLNKEKKNDTLIMKKVSDFLKTKFPPAQNLIVNEDSINLYQKKYISSLGYHTTGFGKTGGLYDLLVWKTEKDTIYNLNYDGKETHVKVYFMDDFITLGWSEYATLGRYYPAGWATKEALFCVKKSYDLKSENFRVSYIGHEGRHFADYKLFPNLKGVGSADLEYRGKLTELSLYSAEGLYKRIQFFINNGNYDSENGHSIAAFCVIRDL
ncbi:MULTISPECIES: hypothetical protein [unclassified Flavobacterium]|uniref:hypothetical protein n=1 Tax=unclassified Flavobacterium TaxID=196869 RepID=UPI0012AA6FAC|nr:MULTISPECIES: hypothetical protein [unclassified Flavobacterium]MBF4485446.1 hypothetical protein [Flavobacterium sp. CSZ]QGK74478.1 hypothetical protein GIY83_10570 [Flavobacterium sp. SLB02]